MKKVILGIATLASLISMSQGAEANIKVGYDFFRVSTSIEIDEMGDKMYNLDMYNRGFVLGLELLPLTFKDSRIKLGAGVEYNFGETTVRYSQKEAYTKKYFVPLYATAKFTYYRHEKSGVNLYTFGRLGYAFSKEEDDNNEVTDANGVYYGLGFGLDYKYFLAEIMYDGNYSERKKDYGLAYSDMQAIQAEPMVLVKDFHHKVGVRLGLQLGTQHFKKPQIITECPKCEPMVVEKIVEVPQIVEVEKIVEKIVEVEKKPEVKKPTTKKKMVKKKAKNTNKKSDSTRVCRWVTIYKK